MGDATPPRAPAEELALGYLIHEMNHTLGGVSKRLGDVEAAVGRQTTDIQKVLALAEWLRRIARKVSSIEKRLSKLEAVTYEGADRPEMHGPPERRRPVIDAEDRWEKSDSYIIDPRAFETTLHALQKDADARARRESFLTKEKTRLTFQIIGGLTIAAVVAVVTWLVSHAVFRP